MMTLINNIVNAKSNIQLL